MDKHKTKWQKKTIKKLEQLIKKLNDTQPNIKEDKRLRR